jgi:uncharacterized protein YndB with AHSA1/START domain
MSGRWQRTFEVSVPVERVWRAMTEPAELAKVYAPVEGARPDPNGGLAHEVLELEPQKRLRWAQQGGTLPERVEFTVVFEATDGGSRFTVTRVGFGEGEDADVFSESHALGWELGFMDLVLYLETGQVVKRHYFGCTQSCTGMSYRERDFGLEVLRVAPRTFAADAGLARGDRLIRIGPAPVYKRSDLWRLLEAVPPGSELEVEYIRGRERRRGSARLSPAEMGLVGE